MTPNFLDNHRLGQLKPVGLVLGLRQFFSNDSDKARTKVSCSYPLITRLNKFQIILNILEDFIKTKKDFLVKTDGN